MLAKFDQTTRLLRGRSVSARTSSTSRATRAARWSRPRRRSPATIGALLRPSANLAFGLSVRTPVVDRRRAACSRPQAPKIARRPDLGRVQRRSFDEAAARHSRRRSVHRDGRRLRGLRPRARRDVRRVGGCAGRRPAHPDPGRSARSRTSIRSSSTATTTRSACASAARTTSKRSTGIVTLRAGGFFDSSATSFTVHATRLRHAREDRGHVRLRLPARRDRHRRRLRARSPRCRGSSGPSRATCDRSTARKSGKPVDNNGNLLPGRERGRLRRLHAHLVGRLDGHVRRALRCAASLPLRQHLRARLRARVRRGEGREGEGRKGQRPRSQPTGQAERTRDEKPRRTRRPREAEEGREAEAGPQEASEKPPRSRRAREEARKSGRRSRSRQTEGWSEDLRQRAATAHRPFSGSKSSAPPLRGPSAAVDAPAPGGIGRGSARPAEAVLATRSFLHAWPRPS